VRWLVPGVIAFPHRRRPVRRAGQDLHRTPRRGRGV